MKMYPGIDDLGTLIKSAEVASVTVHIRGAVSKLPHSNCSSVFGNTGWLLVDRPIVLGRVYNGPDRPGMCSLSD